MEWQSDETNMDSDRIDLSPYFLPSEQEPSATTVAPFHSFTLLATAAPVTPCHARATMPGPAAASR